MKIRTNAHAHALLDGFNRQLVAVCVGVASVLRLRRHRRPGLKGLK